jgi:hypothetical protein
LVFRKGALRVRHGDGGDLDFIGIIGGERHHGVAPRRSLDVLRRRLGQRVLDIKIRQGGAVFGLTARAFATATPGHS